jgi:hypothetical protein
MRSSSSPSAPEAVSTALACSVYTVQPSDRRHAHSLLLLRSNVVCVLFPFIPHTSACRVPESYQSYPTSPPTTPAAHSAVPYSTTLTSPLTIRSSESPLSSSIYRCCCLLTAVTTCSPPLPTVSASAASTSASASAASTATSAAVYRR